MWWLEVLKQKWTEKLKITITAVAVIDDDDDKSISKKNSPERRGGREWPVSSKFEVQNGPKIFSIVVVVVVVDDDDGRKKNAHHSSNKVPAVCGVSAEVVWGGCAQWLCCCVR